MKQVVLFFLTSLFLFSCSLGKSKQDTLKQEIKTLDKKIYEDFRNSELTGDYTLDKESFQKLIALNEEYYTCYPTDSYSDTALNKIASLYMQMEDEEAAAQWRDTILNSFPNSYLLPEVLELQMNYYDFNHYAPEKIMEYGVRLLKLPNLSAEKKEMLNFRLEHVDKTFEELILLQIQLEETTLDE